MSIEGQWGLKMALAYRGFGGQIAVATLRDLLCAAQQATSGGRESDLIYSLPGVHLFASAKDAIRTDVGTSSGVQCGAGTGLLGPESVTIDLHASPASIQHSVMADKKLVCLVKTVGSPWAVYQLKISDAPAVNGTLGLQVDTHTHTHKHTLFPCVCVCRRARACVSLYLPATLILASMAGWTVQYQTADAKGWHTISVPGLYLYSALFCFAVSVSSSLFRCLSLSF